MRLAELRKKHGMTQGELASLAGVQQNTISQWECGKRNPSVPALMNLSRILGCSIDELYGLAPPKQEANRPSA